MRELTETAAKALKPGSDHYTAYVGPPKNYDFMGGTQFALLFALGLREHHKLLDFGCGSLRAGRLFIPYLDAGCYFGLDPNTWLIQEAITRQIGQDIVTIKRPAFSDSDSFSAEVFGERFDFILAQSIFTHAGPNIARKAFLSFSKSLAEGGVCALTFLVGDADTTLGWHYPGTVSYRKALIEALALEAGLVAVAIPWHHPQSTWWLFAKNVKALPSSEDTCYLNGRVVRTAPVYK